MDKRIFLSFCCFFFVQNFLHSQADSTILLSDTTAEIVDSTAPPKIAGAKIHSPKKAAILSAVLPGAGQIYNRKYWKPPIVWAGLGAFIYFWIDNNHQYQLAKTSYLSLLDTISTNNIPFQGSTNVAQISAYKNNFRNNRDLCLIGGIIFYALNIVDALVDAHLMNFDVSDNLSLHVQPQMIPYQTQYAFGAGLNLTYSFQHTSRKRRGKS